MNLAVIGGNGKMGQLIIKEALNRGHQVTSFVRQEGETLAKVRVVNKDLFDLTLEDVKDFEVIVNAFGVWKPEDVALFPKAAKQLSDLLSGKQTRLLVIGSAGSLYVDPEQTTRFIDTPDMPDFAIPVATEQAKALDHLYTREDVRWTYLSPPVDFRPDGPQTGTYQLAGDVLTLSRAGETQISYADAAFAVVDEIENGRYIQQRFSVVAL